MDQERVTVISRGHGLRITAPALALLGLHTGFVGAGDVRTQAAENRSRVM